MSNLSGNVQDDFTEGRSFSSFEGQVGNSQVNMVKMIFKAYTHVKNRVNMTRKQAGD